MADPLEERPDARKLLAQGAEQGYLTLEEILRVFPDAESHVEELEDFYRRLLDMDIEIAKAGELPEEAGDLEPEAPEDEAESEPAVLPLGGPGLTSDPARMYFREIGRVPLLNANQEMQLSIKMTAEDYLGIIKEGLAEKQERPPTGSEVMTEVFRSVARDWEAVQKTCRELSLAPPNMLSMIGEAKALRSSSVGDKEPYLYPFLDGREQEGNGKWHELSSKLFAVCTGLYVMPYRSLQLLKNHYENSIKTDLNMLQEVY